MTVVSAVCGTFWGCLYAYQTLIAGVLAVGAAGFTAGVLWYAAHLPVKAQEQQDKALKERRRVYGLIALSAELQTLANSIGDVRGALDAVAFESSEPRDTLLEVPLIIGDWETVSLLSPELIRRCQALAVRVHRCNRSISRIDWARTTLAPEWRAAEQQLEPIRELAHHLRQEVDALLEAEDE